MRAKKLSISDLTEKIIIHIPQGERDVIGGFTQTEIELKEVWANVESRLKDRTQSEGGTKYTEEFDVYIRPIQIRRTDFLTIRGNKCTVVAMESRANYIHFKAIGA